jgi:hypothetical protein
MFFISSVEFQVSACLLRSFTWGWLQQTPELNIAKLPRVRHIFILPGFKCQHVSVGGGSAAEPIAFALFTGNVQAAHLEERAPGLG